MDNFYKLQIVYLMYGAGRVNEQVQHETKL